MYRILSFMMLIFVFCVPTVSAVDKATADKQKNLTAAIEEVRQRLSEKLGKTIPSINVLINAPEGVYYTSVGQEEFKTTPETNFRFASNTKNFSAAAILKMQQDKWLNIDQHIVENIPGTKTPLVPNTPEWEIPYKDQITIRQLLQHSAGVYDVDNDAVPGCDGQSYTAWIMKNDPDHQFSATELVTQATRNKLSYFKPGENHHYSNTGYSILSEIIARVYSKHADTQKTYGDYLKEQLIGILPLYFPERADDTRMKPPFVKALVYTGNGSKPEIIVGANLSAQVAEGNGWGTPVALNTWLRNLMKGQGPLNKQSVAMMQNSISPGSKNYALGCFYMSNLGYGHNGCRVGYLSIMMYDPKQDVSVIAYLTFVDLTTKKNFIVEMKEGLYQSAWRAREALGYPGRPQVDEK